LNYIFNFIIQIHKNNCCNGYNENSIDTDNPEKNKTSDKFLRKHFEERTLSNVLKWMDYNSESVGTPFSLRHRSFYKTSSGANGNLNNRATYREGSTFTNGGNSTGATASVRKSPEIKFKRNEWKPPESTSNIKLNKFHSEEIIKSQLPQVNIGRLTDSV